MEPHKQNGEPLGQLSPDEILAVQQIRKRKAQEKQAHARREFSPETLKKIDRVCEIMEKMDREEAANKQHATGQGPTPRLFE